ncbi:hypothetical protein PIB30_002551 [Stylosanthes scabra]|uniref:TIR domain-containing protein n=1 Tax=Stylosanthes scabra TaxID=79078 RepID=A0ABU6Y3M6_9FABA|nr:hypothetical protein [Stylosanthes scabra]
MDDVFLSFRGKDTRYGFTGNLYEALSRKGINTFFDDDDIQSGDEITPTLLSAIQESRIAIVVLSPNYDSSSFCLDELVHILRFIKGNNRLVVPVFYDVDPCDVRHQIKSFGKAMAKHEERFKSELNKLQKWRDALCEVAELSGYHFKQGDGYEHMFIANIVDNISKRITRCPALHVADHPVGLQSQLSEVASLLDVESNAGVHMVGIYGIGGIGKTTLAAEVYNLIADHFEGLKAIAGKPDWFGCGSRVIITTRDKHLLTLHGVERTYEVQGLNEEDSLNLLTLNAFKSDDVSPSYMNVLSRVVTYASGLPLALEVIGSNLFGKDLEQWQSALDRYENTLDKNIQKILQVSFDALGKFEQSVFLDIACCFKGYSLDEITDLLQAHYGSCMEYHLQVLVEKCLIKTSRFGTGMIIHYLIEDMGKEIFLERSPEILGKRSRLWSYEDIVNILENNQGTSAVEILYLEFPFFRRERDEDPMTKEKCEDVQVTWDGTAFKEMKNLKTLIIKNGYFSRSPKHLPNSLRVLEWWRYPARCFPNDFHPKKLSILKLPDYPHAIPELDSLSKGLDTLTVLNFDYIRVDSSIGFLPKLKTLNADYCEKLSCFPPAINLPSLEILGLSGCQSLENFPEILQEMKNVTTLFMEGNGIKDLPCSFCNLSGLSRLKMETNEMCRMPSVIAMMPQLNSCVIIGTNEGRVSGKQEKEGLQGILTHSLCSPALTSLFLYYCELSDGLFPLAVACFPNLFKLDLRGSNFTILPECIQQFRFLEILDVDDCDHLREIRGIPPSLKSFSALNCKSLSHRGTSVLLNQEEFQVGLNTTARGLLFLSGFVETISLAMLSFVAILLRDDLHCNPIRVSLFLTINSKQVSCGWRSLVDQLLVSDLSDRVGYYDRALVFENEWNHAKVSYQAQQLSDGTYDEYHDVPIDSIAKEIGVHIWKVKRSSIMEDIQFTDPYKMRELIIMMMMVSMVLPNHENQPLLLQTRIGLWTLLFLTHTAILGISAPIKRSQRHALGWKLRRTTK